jgi:putative component of membrane protein insertase Oxa1/YidC/SpoIIIJ protein YidD
MQKITSVKLPIANIINGATRGLAVTAIRGYQKFISPHKGFSCAHRVLYGCESCSQYFKQVIAEEGILTAIANAKGRFQECRAANEILKKRGEESKARRQYYASRLPNSAVAIESGDRENPDAPEEPKDTGKPNKQKLGGAQWERNQQKKANNNNNNGGGNNNCDYLDCSDCSYALDIFPNNCGSDRNCPDRNCPDLSCPDLSCPDLSCGSADCLSGMDCGGLDCGGLDCSGCGDCGSCG